MNKIVLPEVGRGLLRVRQEEIASHTPEMVVALAIHRQRLRERLFEKSVRPSPFEQSRQIGESVVALISEGIGRIRNDGVSEVVDTTNDPVAAYIVTDDSN